MIKRLFRAALAIGFGAFLTACGGGAGTMLLQAPVADAPQATYNLHAAFNNSITDNTTLPFRVEGLANGVAYEGTGSYEQSMLHTVSEFGNNGGALRKVTPVKMSLAVNGRQVNVETASQDYYSRDGMQLLGRAGPAEVTDVTTYNGLPAEAKVGASGTLYTAQRFSDDSRRASTGTTVATWTLLADTADDTALLVVRVTDNRADGAAGTETTTVLRVSQSGTARRVSETTADASRQNVLTARFM